MMPNQFEKIFILKMNYYSDIISEFSLQKTGKWNAMHVRIAWEIYNHQQKQKSESKEKSSTPSSTATSTSSTKPSTSSSASLGSTTNSVGINPSSLSTPPIGSKPASSDISGRAPPVPGASDLSNNKTPSSDLLRAGAHSALFAPGVPRPPTDPFGLIRPPYPGPSLFGPSHLGKCS